VFGGVARFGQAFTGIEFDRVWLDRGHQLHVNPELLAVLETQAQRALGRVTREFALKDRVAARLATSDPRELPSMDEVARELGMSVRSLRRRLGAEGAAYKDLLEHALIDAAKRMLEDPKISIQEAAYALGFSGPAVFHRAFKRWTGMTPSQYRSSY
jgi:AraC-like DNA-binding protein